MPADVFTIFFIYNHSQKYSLVVQNLVSNNTTKYNVHHLTNEQFQLMTIQTSHGIEQLLRMPSANYLTSKQQNSYSISISMSYVIWHWLQFNAKPPNVYIQTERKSLCLIRYVSWTSCLLATKHLQQRELRKKIEFLCRRLQSSFWNFRPQWPRPTETRSKVPWIWIL